MISKAQSLGALAVRGNHDDAALQRYRLWKQGNPIDDFLWVKHMKTAEEAYLQSLPFSLSIPSHRTLIVHAGLCPGVDLHKQKWVDMYKMRNIKRKGRSWMALEKASEGGTAWAAEWTGESNLVCLCVADVCEGRNRFGRTISCFNGCKGTLGQNSCLELSFMQIAESSIHKRFLLMGPCCSLHTCLIFSNNTLFAMEHGILRFAMGTFS